MNYEGPRDYRLFHYTKKKAHLKAMLSDGIWPRFSEEEFTWLGDTGELYLAFPMVCFCDIQIAAAKHHRGKYGRYAIAIHKNYADSLDIVPVWYISSASKAAQELKDRIPHHPRFSIANAKNSDLFPFLSLMKVAIGSQPSRGRQAGGHEAMAFVEECEWRHVPSVISKDQWRVSYCRGFITDADHAKTKSVKLKLRPEIVDAIYVLTKKDVSDLSSIFPAYASKIHQWPNS